MKTTSFIKPCFDEALMKFDETCLACFQDNSHHNLSKTRLGTKNAPELGL